MVWTIRTPASQPFLLDHSHSSATMSSSNYKDVVTPRGIKYHYYYSPARDGKRTLLFCHGCPSSARDWRKIGLHFEEKGYGIIIPDMLGYGGTDKPTDPTFYAFSAMSQDLVSILDAEKVEKVIAVGHDWYVFTQLSRQCRLVLLTQSLHRGSAAVSRLANWYPERISAYAFFALPYLRPLPKDYNYEAAIVKQKQQYGYELYGYWSFFNRDDANQVIQEHVRPTIPPSCRC